MNPIVLFDGVCNFCDASVQFIIKNDPKGKIRFASLQSDIGQKLLKQHEVPPGVDSMILIEGSTSYIKSTAALRIAKHLKGPWKLAFAFLIIPVPIRNLAYDIIARNRYKWFGQKDSCMLPPPEIRRRFLT